MNTLTLFRQRVYTDAYGRDQTEAVSAHIPITNRRSIVRKFDTYPNLHPEYLTPLGMTALMLRAIHANEHNTARMYRDAAMRETRHNYRLSRLWNLATMPTPKLPGRKEHAS